MLDENGVKVILYTQADELYSTIYGVFYDSGAWGEPIALTDGTFHEADFAATVTEGGNLQILSNRVAVAQDESGNDIYSDAKLVMISAQFACDLEIADIYYDCENYVENYDMTFDLTVANNGEVAAENLRVKPLAKDYIHESDNFSPGSKYLKWLHQIIANTKAFINGTYYGTSTKRLQMYLSEFCFRFNRRSFDGKIFDRLLVAMVG